MGDSPTCGKSGLRTEPTPRKQLLSLKTAWCSPLRNAFRVLREMWPAVIALLCIQQQFVVSVDLTDSIRYSMCLQMMDVDWVTELTTDNSSALSSLGCLRWSQAIRQYEGNARVDSSRADWLADSCHGEFEVCSYVSDPTPEDPNARTATCLIGPTVKGPGQSSGCAAPGVGQGPTCIGAPPTPEDVQRKFSWRLESLNGFADGDALKFATTKAGATGCEQLLGAARANVRARGALTYFLDALGATESVGLWFSVFTGLIAFVVYGTIFIVVIACSGTAGVSDVRVCFALCEFYARRRCLYFSLLFVLYLFPILMTAVFLFMNVIGEMTTYSEDYHLDIPFTYEGLFGILLTTWIPTLYLYATSVSPLLRKRPGKLGQSAAQFAATMDGLAAGKEGSDAGEAQPFLAIHFDWKAPPFLSAEGSVFQGAVETVDVEFERAYLLAAARVEEPAPAQGASDTTIGAPNSRRHRASRALRWLQQMKPAILTALAMYNVLSQIETRLYDTEVKATATSEDTPAPLLPPTPSPPSLPYPSPRPPSPPPLLPPIQLSSTNIYDPISEGGGSLFSTLKLSMGVYDLVGWKTQGTGGLSIPVYHHYEPLFWNYTSSGMSAQLCDYLGEFRGGFRGALDSNDCRENLNRGGFLLYYEEECMPGYAPSWVLFPIEREDGTRFPLPIIPLLRVNSASDFNPDQYLAQVKAGDCDLGQGFNDTGYNDHSYEAILAQDRSTISRYCACGALTIPAPQVYLAAHPEAGSGEVSADDVLIPFGTGNWSCDAFAEKRNSPCEAESPGSFDSKYLPTTITIAEASYPPWSPQLPPQPPPPPLPPPTPPLQPLTSFAVNVAEFLTMPPLDIVFGVPEFALATLLAMIPLVCCGAAYLIILCGSTVPAIGSAAITADVTLAFHVNEFLLRPRVAKWRTFLKVFQAVGLLIFAIRVATVDQALLAMSASQLLLAAVSVSKLLRGTKMRLSYAQFTATVRSLEGKPGQYKATNVCKSRLVSTEALVDREVTKVLHGLVLESAAPGTTTASTAPTKKRTKASPKTSTTVDAASVSV